MGTNFGEILCGPGEEGGIYIIYYGVLECVAMRGATDDSVTYCFDVLNERRRMGDHRSTLACERTAIVHVSSE